MLNPGDRSLLLECLRPPAGYALDRAIGTTYSLDLLALLTVPLAFTFFDWEDKDGRPTADPLAVLEAVRRHSGRIQLFWQAGELQIPPAGRPLLAYVEESVIAVNAPDDEGVFHPKVWCLRYVADGQPVTYRLLCLSRNLTFDRSWDTVLALEGELVDRQKGYSANRPLAEFIERLPSIAAQPITEAVASPIRAIAEELRRVDFRLPADVEALNFWPLGLSGRRQWPFGGGRRRMLIMSPFLSSELVNELAGDREGCILISRPDQLAQMTAETLALFSHVYAINPAAEDLNVAGDEATAAAFSGLHAKLFIEDDGHDAHVYTGSANATNPAFSKNVEFLVELIGKKSKLGVSHLLDPAGDRHTAFHDLLVPWTPPPDFEAPDTTDQRALDRALAKVRRAIASAALHVDVSATEQLFRMDVVADGELAEAGDAIVTCWPASLSAEMATPVTFAKGVIASFANLPLSALTGFMAFEITVEAKGLRGTSSFAARLPLNGAPADRFDRLLASMLTDKEQVRRLLWLLLQADHEAMIGAFREDDPSAESSGWSHAALEGHPLFEQMVKALARNPQRLRETGRLIEDLSRTKDGNDLLPEGLLDLWRSLKAVLEQGRDASGSA
jgi:hypothetical protein